MAKRYTTTQMKKNDYVVVTNGGYEKLEKAETVAIKIAQRCHGMLTWQGVMDSRGPGGLARLANAWLKKNHADSNAIVVENDLGEYSIYYPSWK